MSTELFNALAGSDIPKTRRSIDRTRQAVVASEIELAARQLCRVSAQRKKALPGAHVPNLRRVVKRCCHQAVTIGIEVQRYNLGMVPF